MISFLVERWHVLPVVRGNQRRILLDFRYVDRHYDAIIRVAGYPGISDEGQADHMTIEAQDPGFNPEGPEKAVQCHCLLRAEPSLSLKSVRGVPSLMRYSPVLHVVVNGLRQVARNGKRVERLITPVVRHGRASDHEE